MVQRLFLWANLCACKIKLSPAFFKRLRELENLIVRVPSHVYRFPKKWGSCCVTRNFYKKKILRDGCPVPPGKTFRRMVLRQISQGMVSGSFHKRQVSLTHPPPPRKGRKKNLIPKAPENQEITTRNPLAKWGRNVYNSDRRKKCVENFKRQTFLKTKIREKDSCGVRQNRTI